MSLHLFLLPKLPFFIYLITHHLSIISIIYQSSIIYVPNYHFCHLICLFPWAYSQGFIWTFVSLSSVTGLPGSLNGKESACNARDLGSIPVSGRSPGEGHGNPLQYSCLENQMDRRAWWATVHGVAMSRTWLKTNTFTFFQCCNNVFKITTCFLTVHFSCSVMSDSLQPHGLQHTRLLYHQLPEFTQTHVHWVSDAIQPSHPLLSPSPPAFNLCQHQGLFKWVSSSHQANKVLEFQLQHQSFQWKFRTDFL